MCFFKIRQCERYFSLKEFYLKRSRAIRMKHSAELSLIFDFNNPLDYGISLIDFAGCVVC